LKTIIFDLHTTSFFEIGHTIWLRVNHTITHNQHNQAQSYTIAQSHNRNANFRTIAQSKCKFLHNHSIKVQIFAQSHNQNANFCTIAQSKCKFFHNRTINIKILKIFPRYLEGIAQSIRRLWKYCYNNPDRTITQSHNCTINIWNFENHMGIIRANNPW
jgi:hypothetical protein